MIVTNETLFRSRTDDSPLRPEIRGAVWLAAVGAGWAGVVIVIQGVKWWIGGGQ